MINLKNISLRRGKHLLLEKLDWTIYHKQRIGLIGANGAGKSSLFALLLNQLQPDLGAIEIPRQLRLSHVAQEMPAYHASSIDYVLDGDTELRALEAALAEANSNNDGEKIAIFHEKLSIIDAYTAPARAAQLLSGLGFSHAEQQKSINEFSGGWRVRLNLAKALMCRSDFLLLDEPTNHLDLDAVLWLEQWLIRYSGTLMIISHDRDFLDKTVDHIAFISQKRLKLYTGNYSTFEKNRADELMLQQATFEKQQRRLSHLKTYVDRFRASASKARQAQSRLKAIERMDVVCAVQADSAFQFSFKEPSACPNPLICLDRAAVAYGDRTILSNINLTIAPKERIAILGPNGAGKSTLIKLMANALSVQLGSRTAGSGLKIGYFAQHQVDQLQLTDTPFIHLRRLAEKTPEQDIRNFLGGFDFAGERVFEPIKNFSGGEKSRLALAMIVWQQPNLLLLDEPTNHLDLEMRLALSLALQAYGGAMLLVSHDRFLVRTTTDTILLVVDGQLQEFDGDVTDYEKWLLDYRKQQAKPASGQKVKSELSKKEQRQQDARIRELRRPLLQKIKKLETELSDLEHQLDKVETLLRDAALYDDDQKPRLQETLAQQASLKKLLIATEESWLTCCVERDNLT